MQRKQFILLLIWILCFPGYIFAEEKESIEDRLIGSTFKTLAKAFVAIADIDKLKKDNIAKLNKMEEDKFRKQYSRVYEAIKDLPYHLKVEYGIIEQMTKGGAIKDVESLDKRKIYEIIDSVPDKIITNQFKQYLYDKKQELQKSNLAEQIHKFWNQVTQKATISTSSHNHH